MSQKDLAKWGFKELQLSTMPSQPTMSTLPHRPMVRLLSEIRYCLDNGTHFHHFTAYIVSFADAHHIQFIFKELGRA